MSDFLQRLKTEILIDSGVLGTNLVRRGYDQTENLSWWAFNHSDIYQELVKAFVNAGCDLVLAAGANRLRLKRHGLQDKAREINYQVAKLTKEVTPNNCYLISSLVATDLFLPPIGDASVDEVYESYVEQIVIAEDIGVDLYRVTCSDIEQTGLAIKAVRDNSQLPIIGVFYFNPTPRGFRTMTGIDPTTAAKKLEEFGVDVIGTMCGGINYEETTAALKEMRAACSKYLSAKPNAGIPQLINGKTVHPATPEEMAKAAPNWVEAGARLIGGCCGTTLEHIAKVVAVLK